MTRTQIILVSAVVVAAAAGGYGVYLWLHKPAVTGTPLTPGARRARGAGVVPAVRFTDVTVPSMVHFRHENGATPQKLLPETMGGGVAVLDYDGDGRPDLLFVNACPSPGHTGPAAADAPAPTLKLFRNKGNFVFEDVTESAGLAHVLYGMGVAVGDYDNDGRPDVFVSCVGKHRLFRNVDGKRFEDVTDAAGVGGPGEWPKLTKEQFLARKEPIPFGSSCTFLDYDGDGRLDLFVCHHVTWSPEIDLSIASTLTGAARNYQQPQ